MPQGWRSRYRAPAEAPLNEGAQAVVLGATVPKIVRGGTWVKGGTLPVVASEAPNIHLYFPEACTISGVEINTNGGSGSCVVDIWNDTYAFFPPTSGDSITAAAKPTIAGATKYKDTTLTGWDKTVSADSILTLHLDSTSTFTSISVFITLALT